MGYRHQFYIDDETKDILDKLPEKKRSDYVRTAVKKYTNLKDQAEAAPAAEEQPPQRLIVPGRWHESTS